jgi:hypothetical protein
MQRAVCVDDRPHKVFDWARQYERPQLVAAGEKPSRASYRVGPVFVFDADKEQRRRVVLPQLVQMEWTAYIEERLRRKAAQDRRERAEEREQHARELVEAEEKQRRDKDRTMLTGLLAGTGIEAVTVTRNGKKEIVLAGDVAALRLAARAFRAKFSAEELKGA